MVLYMVEATFLHCFLVHENLRLAFLPPCMSGMSLQDGLQGHPALLPGSWLNVRSSESFENSLSIFFSFSRCVVFLLLTLFLICHFPAALLD